MSGEEATSAGSSAAFHRLQEAREKIEVAKSKLNDIIIQVESDGGGIKISANANKTITRIEIAENMLKVHDREALEKTLLDTVNRALDEAARKGEIEMKKITKDVLPNFPGLV